MQTQDTQGDPGTRPTYPKIKSYQRGNLVRAAVLQEAQGAIERRIAWLNRLRDHVRSKDHDCWALCGDFNVKADGPPWGARSYFSQDEKDVLEELLQLGFVDIYRSAHPCAATRPGWTSGCTENDPAKGGARLHLILASETLAQRLRSACVAVDSEPWPRKDAPPLIVNFADVGLR